VRIIRTFIASHATWDEADREVARNIKDRLQRELYRREREIYPEFVDFGGEGEGA
jgi:hypothetical protein